MLDHALERLITIFKTLSSISLAGTMLITCADVVGRFFGNPILGAVEIGVMLAALSLGFSLPYAHRQGAHIGVEILYMHLGERWQALLKALTGGVCFGLFCIIAWMCGAYASDMQANGEVSMTLQLPMHPVIFAISSCFWVLAGLQLIEAASSVRKAVIR